MTGDIVVWDHFGPLHQLVEAVSLHSSANSRRRCLPSVRCKSLPSGVARRVVEALAATVDINNFSGTWAMMLAKNNLTK